MHRNQLATALLGLLLMTLPAFGQAKRSDAIVVVLTASPLGFQAGNAVMIADGTYALTAQHLIFDGPDGERSQSMGVVNLFSPYRGDRCEAYLVAQIPELDIAILRTRWKGHPAVELAGDAEIRAAKEVEIDSRFNLAVRLGRGESTAVEVVAEVLHERLPVDFVGIRDETTRGIMTRGYGKIQQGWSGSPLFVSGSSRVAAIFSTISHAADGREGHLWGSSVEPIRAVMKEMGLSDSLLSPENVLPRPSDTEEVNKLWLETRYLGVAKRNDDWLAQSQLLVKSRPDHPLAYLNLALAYESLKNPAAAEAAYRKAIELDPQTLASRIYFGQFLSSDMRFADATKVLEEARALDPLNTVWGASLVQSLSREKRYEESIKVGRAVLEIAPNDGLAWMTLSDTQKLNGDRAGSIESLKRAAELMGPGLGPYVAYIGQVLEAKKFEEAEILIRAYLEKKPQHPMPHFMMADLLHRKGRDSDAIFEAERALDLPEVSNPSRALIRAAMAKWKSNPTSGPAIAPPPFGL